MHQLVVIQNLPISLEKAWDFFSSPKNLPLITPKELNLVPTSELPDRMYPGIFIKYTVKPLFGIPTKWVTEITHVRELEYFVDEQRVGPYSIWHHQHHFQKINGGVAMTDIIDYKVPYGLVGNLAQKIIVGRKVKEIFEFRRSKLIELFGEV